MLRSQTNSVLSAVFLCAALTACDAAQPKATKELAPGVALIGRLSDGRLTESSGVAASRRHTNVFWTHNDGGGLKRQALFAVDRAGNTLASFPVTSVAIHDWEDIAIDDAGHLFIGDIGNNDAKRDELAVYEVDEPDPMQAARLVAVKRQWRLRYPKDSPRFDCESLFVWQDHGYIVSKVFDDARAQIFRFPLAETKEPLTLELVVTMKIDSPVTGADISADGSLLGLVAKNGAYAYRIDGTVARAGKGKPHSVKYGQMQIEGCCFVPDGLLATCEGREILLFTNAAFRGKKAE